MILSFLLLLVSTNCDEFTQRAAHALELTPSATFASDAATPRSLEDLLIDLVADPSDEKWIEAKTAYPQVPLETWISEIQKTAGFFGVEVPSTITSLIETDRLAAVQAAEAAKPKTPEVVDPLHPLKHALSKHPTPSLEELAAELGQSEDVVLRQIYLNEIATPLSWLSLSAEEYSEMLKTKTPEEIAAAEGVSLAKIYFDLKRLRFTSLQPLDQSPSQTEWNAFVRMLSRINQNQHNLLAAIDSDSTRGQIIERMVDEYQFNGGQIGALLGLSESVVERYRSSTNLGSTRRDTTWMRAISKDGRAHPHYLEEYLREAYALGLSPQQASTKLRELGVDVTADQIQSRWRTLGVLQTAQRTAPARQSLGLEIPNPQKRQKFMALHVVSFFARAGRLPEASDFKALLGNETSNPGKSIDGMEITEYEVDGKPIIPFNYMAFTAAFNTSEDSHEGIRQAWIGAKNVSQKYAHEFGLDPQSFRISAHEFKIDLNDELRKIRRQEMADVILEALMKRQGEWPTTAEWYKVFGMSPQKILGYDMYGENGGQHEYRIFDGRLDMLVEIRKANDRRNEKVSTEERFSFDKLRNRRYKTSPELSAIFQLEATEKYLDAIVREEKNTSSGKPLLQRASIETNAFEASPMQRLETLHAIQETYRTQPGRFQFADPKSFEIELTYAIDYEERIVSDGKAVLEFPDRSFAHLPDTDESLKYLYRVREFITNSQARTRATRYLNLQIEMREKQKAARDEVARMIPIIVEAKELRLTEFNSLLFPSRLDALLLLKEGIRDGNGFKGRSRQTRLAEIDLEIDKEYAALFPSEVQNVAPATPSPVAAASQPAATFKQVIEDIIRNKDLTLENFSSRGFDSRYDALVALRKEMETADGFLGRSRQTRMKELDAVIESERNRQTLLNELAHRRKLPVSEIPRLSKNSTPREDAEAFLVSLNAYKGLLEESKKNKYLAELNLHLTQLSDEEDNAIQIHLTFMSAAEELLTRETMRPHRDILPAFSDLVAPFGNEDRMMDAVYEGFKKNRSIIRGAKRERLLQMFARMGYE